MAKGDFDKKYNELLSVHDYRGLATLLRNTNYDTQDARNKAFAMAERYEEEADIDDKILGGASDKQKAAYNFITYGPHKLEDGSQDEYSRKFSEAWNAMANSDGYIHIRTHYKLTVKGFDFKEKTIVDEDYLDLFSEGSGISVDDFNKCGIIRGKDGELLVSTDNPYKINICNGIKHAIDTYYNNYIQSDRYDPIIGKDDYYDHILPKKYFDSKLYNDKFKRYDGYSVYSTNPINSINEAIEQANDEYGNLMLEQTPYVLQTMVTGYMGEDDKQLQDAFAQGAMDLQTFKEARKILEEKYNRLLQTSSLTQYQVWTTDEDNNGSQFLVELKDNIEKAAINDEINLAMADGRLHYSHASNGLAYGTMIVIDQKYDNKGTPMKDYPARRFFVKDLFKSEAETNLRQDTQVDAQLQYAKHQTYGHTYRTKDGGRLEDWDGSSDSAIYVDEFGNERAVSKAEILNIMDDDIITKRMLDYYRKANARNDKGRNYTEEGFQVYGNAGIDTDVLHNNVAKKSLAVMSAKYGDPNSDYVKMKANKLTSTIMRILFEEI